MRLITLILLTTALAGGEVAHPLTLADFDALAVDTVALNLNGTPVADAEFTHVPRLTRLEHLELDSRITPAALPQIAQLRSLRWLDLSNSKLDDRAMAVIAALPELRHLDLDDSTIGDAGLAELVNAKHLRWLGLGRTTTARGITALAACPELEVLVCSNADLDDTAVTVIGRLSGLRRLILPSPRVTDAGVLALADLTRLTGLHLAAPGITDRSVPALARMVALTDLALHGTAISEEGTARLKQALPAWRGVTVSAE